MRTTIQIPVALLLVATTTFAQDAGFQENFESYAVGQQISSVDDWSANASAVVENGTAPMNFTKVLALDPGTGFSSTAIRSIPAETSSSFVFDCGLAYDGDCEIRICSAAATSNLLAGIRLDASTATASSINGSGSVPTAAPGNFESFRFVGSRGGDIELFYANTSTPFATVPWPATGDSAATLEFFASGTSGSRLEVDDLVMARLVIGDPASCMQNPNSTGLVTELIVTGSSAAAANDVMLTMTSMPLNEGCFFIASKTPGFIMMPNGSQGNLCVLGNIARFRAPGQVGTSGPAGEFSIVIDLTSVPEPSMNVAVMAGETWRFQGWHRDKVGGSVTNNFSAAVDVTFN